MQHLGIPIETLQSDCGPKILQLLEEDALLAIHDHVAESQQVELVIELTSRLNPSNLLEAEELRNQSDARLAQDLAVKDVADEVATQQALQKLAAEERNVTADAVFARALQADLNAGHDTHHDAEHVLGLDTVRKTLLPDDHPSASGKGKGKGFIGQDNESDIAPTGKKTRKLRVKPLPASRDRSARKFFCRNSVVGFASSKLVNWSNQLILLMKHPHRGRYTASVYRAHIFTPNVFSRYIARKLEVWVAQRKRESRPKFYCPNAQCSALLFIDDLDSFQAPYSTCLHCKIPVCLSCRSEWHQGKRFLKCKRLVSQS
ncbi:uncharacterized protein EI90DRAFT_925917 [Cantharellus anzutake]|uniref:uncharacterized protein n=1 Tax=Cantharellus anzutake TaxID=1750568 RepID=UPI001906CC84|nr:uncharacterized protein EI90DRAFT_925917 [Cantharellus anzutake]KAF8332111.1 hypothetical protein EI90DRAFT_925917 [Cantharellus anzutake]